MSQKALDDYLKQPQKQNTEKNSQNQQKTEEVKYEIIGFYREKEFQETPIGKIPKEWKIVKLGNVALKIKSGSTPLKKIREYWGGAVHFVTISDMSKSRKYLLDTKEKITELALQNMRLNLIPEDSILLSMYGTIGKVVINRIPVTVSQNIAAIIPERNVINNEYLYYALNYYSFQFSKAKIITLKHLDLDMVKNTIIPLPPLEEQWGIAEVLSSVDQAIEVTERLIQKLEQAKKVLMQELLTKGIGHKEFQETPIGKIPKEWKFVRVADLFTVETGTTPSTKVKEYWENGSINWITPQDLSKLRNRVWIWESERKITELALKKTNLSLLPEGSIILSTRAPVGYVVVLKAPATFNQGCKGLIPKNPSDTVPEFYAYYLLKIKPLLEAKSGGSTFKELSKKTLEGIYVPFPPLEEQIRIADILKSVDDWIELEVKRKEKLRSLKRGLMDELLTGRIRVMVEKIPSGVK